MDIATSMADKNAGNKMFKAESQVAALVNKKLCTVLQKWSYYNVTAQMSDVFSCATSQK